MSLVEVTFDEPSQQPPPIRVAAEQNAAASRSATPRIGAWEIVGAFRQRGAVAVKLSDQIHAHFERAGRVRQIETGSLPEALRSPEAIAAFETSGSSWGIDVHTQPRQRKVSVTPAYLLHLGEQGATLDVTLDYQISGGRIFEMRVDLHGWELGAQPIESGGAVDQGEQHVTAEGVLILPMKDADVERVRVRLTLQRQAGLGKHELALPEALEAFTTPGELTITCDDAWRASADLEKSAGVSAVERPADAVATARQVRPEAASSAPTSLKFQTSLPQPRIALEVSERDQVITATSTVEARLQGDVVEAQQTLSYEILNQPATQLAATVAADLLGNEGLLLLMDGKPLPSAAMDIQPLLPVTGAKGEDDLRLIVTLPQPTVGRVRLAIRSQLSLNAAQRSGAAPFTLSLAVPDQPAKSTANIRSADAAVVVKLAGVESANSWAPVSSEPLAAAASNNGALQLTASGLVRELALALESANVQPPVATRIEAAWAQTWVAGGMRQDRLVYRFRTSGERIAVALPAEFAEVEVLLDGRLPTTDRTQQGVIAIALPAGGGSHTLELRRHTPLHIGSWGKQRVAFPRIEGADAWSPFFWQLIMPPDLEAMATPEGMNAEYQLGWQGLRWGREPTQTQRDLERWTRATTAPTPSPRTNQYLYSAFQPPESAEFLAIRRVWIVVAAGLAALAIGLAWLYTSLAASLAFWWIVCVAAAATLFIYPEAAVLMVQAIILGGSFTILSAVVRWLLPGARPRRAPAPAAASSVTSLAATQSWKAEAPDNGFSGSGAPIPPYQPTGMAP